MHVRTLLLAILTANASVVTGITQAAAADRSPACPAAAQRPAWYVRKATAAQTYEASRLSRAETHDFALGPWYYAGPFHNPNGQGFATQYPPEKGVDLKASYQGKGGATIRWKRGREFKDGVPNDLAIAGSDRSLDS